MSQAPEIEPIFRTIIDRAPRETTRRFYELLVETSMRAGLAQGVQHLLDIGETRAAAALVEFTMRTGADQFASHSTH